MVRVVWLTVGFGVAVAALPLRAGQPPVEAPHPSSSLTTKTDCPACRFLPGGPRSGQLVPSQFGPELAAPADTPQRLPLPDEVAPLQPSAPPSAALQKLVEEYLPDLSAEERRIWAEELRPLPTEIARDLLAARSAAGEPRALPASPEAPLVPPPQSEPPATVVDADPVPMRRSTPQAVADDQSLAVLQRVEAILRHNIANALTVGYKRLRPRTTEAGAAGGVDGLSVERCEIQGELEETGRDFDLAIDGPGLFQVRQGDSLALTRGGAFRLVADGRLALEASGETWLLYPEISIPPEVMSLNIRDDGLVVCILPGGAEIGLGQIELARVADLSQLESVGGGLFAVPDSAGAVTIGLPLDEGFGTIWQGCLERSNVDLPAEIAALEKLRQLLAALRGTSPSQLAMPESGGQVR